VTDEDDPYRDPDLYDLEYADMHEDVAYYTAIAVQSEGDMLELGCGTGRLTVPMSRAPVRIVGVDLSEAMLTGCRRKLSALPEAQRRRVELVQGDFRTLRLGRTFATVLWPFNALHHCKTDADLHDAIQTLAAHVRPNGLLAVDAYLPDLELYDRDASERFEGRTFLDPRTGGALESWEQGWWDDATRTHHVVYHYRHRDGRLEKAHLRFRMWNLDELHAAFADAGFQLEHEASDFRDAPLQARSLKWVATFRFRP
jgi:SAM-dependent methyltransferase